MTFAPSTLHGPGSFSLAFTETQLAAASNAPAWALIAWYGSKKKAISTTNPKAANRQSDRNKNKIALRSGFWFAGGSDCGVVPTLMSLFTSVGAPKLPSRRVRRDTKPAGQISGRVKHLPTTQVSITAF